MSADERVLCVPRQFVHQLGGREIGTLQGLSFDVGRYAPLFMPNPHMRWLRRAVCEDDPRLKQLIPYILLVFTEAGEKPVYLSYQRTKLQGEQRLHDKYSIGIGGHVNPDDVMLNDTPVALEDEMKMRDPFQVAACRELYEEVEIWPTMRQGPFPYAIINDERDDVGRVHTGVVMTAHVGPSQVHPEESMTNLKWMTAQQLWANKDRYEGWSQILIEALAEVEAEQSPEFFEAVCGVHD